MPSVPPDPAGGQAPDIPEHYAKLIAVEPRQLSPEERVVWGHIQALGRLTLQRFAERVALIGGVMARDGAFEDDSPLPEEAQRAIAERLNREEELPSPF